MRGTSVKEEMDLEKLREQKAKADLATIAVKEKSGELISTDYVQSELNRFCADIKDRIRLIPAKHSIELIEQADTVENFKSVLKRVIDQELNDVSLVFSEPDIEPDQEPEQEPETEQEIDLS